MLFSFPTCWPYSYLVISLLSFIGKLNKTKNYHFFIFQELNRWSYVAWGHAVSVSFLKSGTSFLWACPLKSLGYIFCRLTLTLIKCDVFSWLDSDYHLFFILVIYVVCEKGLREIISASLPPNPTSSTLASSFFGGVVVVRNVLNMYSNCNFLNYRLY